MILRLFVKRESMVLRCRVLRQVGTGDPGSAPTVLVTTATFISWNHRAFPPFSPRLGRVNLVAAEYVDVI